MIPADSVLQQFKESQMPTTLQGWRQIMGWLAHSARFLYQRHCLLGQLQRLRASPSVEGWRNFLTKLQASFVKNAFFIQEGARQFTILSDASSQGWGVVLLQGSRVI